MVDSDSLTGTSIPPVQRGFSDDCEVNPNDLSALIEALLLVAPEPADLRALATAAGVSIHAIEETLAVMQADETRGLVVVRHQETVHLASAPRFAPVVRRFLRLEREAKLTGAALETVALIAYRQPVTRAEIEFLRGVDCSGVLATLHARGLVEVAGKLPTVGNPNQYVTTVEFLRQFGLRSLTELPSLAELAGGATDRLFEGLATSRPGDDHHLTGHVTRP
ncbi:MAG: SMC-Scp complex subunit ScpB [Chloroflexota bacterium]|nr:SMC-Scp complex subunit ScpB [Chloroflexia bacterium]MDQ3081200.1 SMC-Scp complex subunit ScpB [Gemmatimonadota bacterium]MDQ3227401.1 SMC-Scp complex subunit ScpB [Chloroflexota bacterium]